MALAGMSDEFKQKQALFFNQQHSGLLDVTDEVAAWTEELVKQENFVITSKPVEYLEVSLLLDHNLSLNRGLNLIGTGFQLLVYRSMTRVSDADHFTT